MLEPNQETTTILMALTAVLPKIAVNLIKQNKHLPNSAKVNFINNLDNPAEHTPQWHQYGIITHGIRSQYYLQSAPIYLKEWNIGDVVEGKLQKEVDGIAKGQLLHIAALLHDIGKFIAKTKEGFKEHEVYSGQAIRTTVAPF
jgi:hypothetical protein